MARDLGLARAVVDAVLRPIMATELGRVLVEVNGYEFALQTALDDVADLLDPAEDLIDVEV